MPLNPEAAAFLKSREEMGSRPVNELTPEQAREQSIRFALLNPSEPVARTHDLQVPGPGGAISLRLYYPTASTPLPIVVFFHGGGWVVGNLDVADSTCRQWANAMQCLVVSVNYRHAPEHRFPAAAEDAYAATRWTSEHAAELGGDPTRLAVAGMSAGGNLAAVVPLMARDRGTPPIALQILWVPITDCNFENASYRENADGYGLTRAGMMWFWQQYVPEPAERLHPYVSPLRAPTLAKLPPAIVVTAEYDPLRDEGIAYANALRAAGVPVQHLHYEGMIHGFLGAPATNDVAAATRAHFAPTPA